MRQPGLKTDTMFTAEGLLCLYNGETEREKGGGRQFSHLRTSNTGSVSDNLAAFKHPGSSLNLWSYLALILFLIPGTVQ